MASKKLSISLNQKERLIINDISTITGVTDRAKIIKELAMVKANEWLKQIVSQRMKQREELAKKEQEENSGESGDTGSDTGEARVSADSDSDVVAAEENPVADAGGSEESPRAGGV